MLAKSVSSFFNFMLDRVSPQSVIYEENSRKIVYKLPEPERKPEQVNWLYINQQLIFSENRLTPIEFSISFKHQFKPKHYLSMSIYFDNKYKVMTCINITKYGLIHKKKQLDINHYNHKERIYENIAMSFEFFLYRAQVAQKQLNYLLDKKQSYYLQLIQDISHEERHLSYKLRQIKYKIQMVHQAQDIQLMMNNYHQLIEKANRYSDYNHYEKRKFRELKNGEEQKILCRVMQLGNFESFCDDYKNFNLDAQKKLFNKLFFNLINAPYANHMPCRWIDLFQQLVDADDVFAALAHQSLKLKPFSILQPISLLCQMYQKQNLLTYLCLLEYSNLDDYHFYQGTLAFTALPAMILLYQAGMVFKPYLEPVLNKTLVFYLLDNDQKAEVSACKEQKWRQLHRMATKNKFNNLLSLTLKLHLCQTPDLIQLIIGYCDIEICIFELGKIACLSNHPPILIAHDKGGIEFDTCLEKTYLQSSIKNRFLFFFHADNQQHLTIVLNEIIKRIIKLNLVISPQEQIALFHFFSKLVIHFEYLGKTKETEQFMIAALVSFSLIKNFNTQDLNDLFHLIEIYVNRLKHNSQYEFSQLQQMQLYQFEQFRKLQLPALV